MHFLFLRRVPGSCIISGSVPTTLIRSLPMIHFVIGSLSSLGSCPQEKKIIKLCAMLHKCKETDFLAKRRAFHLLVHVQLYEIASQTPPLAAICC